MAADETVVARFVLETADTELLVQAELDNYDSDVDCFTPVAAVILTASTIDGLSRATSDCAFWHT